MATQHDPRELLIGEMAVLLRTITAEQLDECVQQQIDERHRRPLGEVMVERGFVRTEALTALLTTQTREI